MPTIPKILLRRVLFAVTLSLATTFEATAQAGPFEDGLAAYERGNDETALQLWRPLAENGHDKAEFRFGCMYRFGRGVPQDYAAAVRLYHLAAEQGNTEAQLNLAVMYGKGQGVPQNADEAMRLLRMAAEQGYAPAQFVLGEAYTRRNLRDYTEAVRWYRLAAEQGDADAQVNLGYMYYNGQGVSEDHAEAVRWNRMAIEQGHVLARYNLEAMRETGAPSPASAGVRLDHIAAELGDIEAQYNLGITYTTRAELADNTEAAHWHRRAAELGHATAQFIVGFKYHDGDGVPQDFAKAVRWYRRSAEQGHDLAQNFLGTMYAKGLGVPQDYVQAYFWYNLSGTQGDEEARQLRDNIADKMTRAHIAEAQRLARAWRPRKEGVPIASREGKENAVPKKGDLKKHATGSGFVVSSSGHILTNLHVVGGCRQVRIPPSAVAEIVASDAHSDLALLKVSDVSLKHATFRQGRGVRPGNSVVVAGFPLQGVLTSDLNITTGTVSALAGPGDDRTLMQVTAPVQPGNSGGPLLDLAGNVVGVVVGKLNAIKLARLTGDIPQNVNFAIQAGTARSFLDAYSVRYDTVPSTEMLSPATVADRARQFTVLVECWK